MYPLISLLTRALASHMSLFTESELNMSPELRHPGNDNGISWNQKNSMRTDQGDNMMATHSDSRSTIPQSVSRGCSLQRVSQTSVILAAAMSLGGVPLFADDQQMRGRCSRCSRSRLSSTSTLVVENSSVEGSMRLTRREKKFGPVVGHCEWIQACHDSRLSNAWQCEKPTAFAMLA